MVKHSSYSRSLLLLLSVLWMRPAAAQDAFRPAIPKTWDDAALEAMHMPLAQAKYTPKQAPSEFYYKIPVIKIYKKYPIYHPDREPKGYMEWLQQQEPEIVFDPAKLVTKEDWIRAGELVFEASNSIPLTVPFAALRRNPEWYRRAEVPLTKDGVYGFEKYVIRQKGQVELARGGCAACHTRVMPDGSVIRGAQGNGIGGKIGDVTSAMLPPPREGRSITTFRDRIVGAPWLGPDNPSTLLNALTPEQERTLNEGPPSVFVRHGTSPWAPTKVPDLIGIQDRKYLDHTGLLIHRSIGDLMRYGVMNQTMDFYATYDGWRPPGRDSSDLPDPSTLVRYSDEQAYAMALYIYSLKPPVNPNKPDALSRHGEKVFRSEGCGTCHTAPLYTNNKLTPADGFNVPADHRAKYDIMPMSVGTDPMLALKTRRGTGYYKVPSLRGLWYRSPLEHSGSVMTLEEWFDPSRLKPDYVPTGFKGLSKTRAVRGHEFGLRLSDKNKEALIAFLKTL
jgi:mono/diheme cytochrome c family protein